MINVGASQGSMDKQNKGETAGERVEIHRTLSGYAASQGVAVGHCTVVTRIEDLAKVAQGAILVFETASPKLSVIMPKLGGLVTARGGSLTVAAGYAREYGVPAVVGVSGATETIEDGDLIRVDGTAGVVQLIMKKGGAR